MGKKVCLLFLFLFMLAGCSSKVTESYLVGGSWYEKAEYEEGERVDEPSCLGFFTKGLEFKEDGIVYNEDREVDYEYKFLNIDDEPAIIFIREKGNRHHYHIEKISDNEIRLSGAYYGSSHESCNLERKD